MATLPVELEWCRDSKGYSLVTVPGYGKWIVGNGGGPDRYRPFELGEAPLLAFANADSEEKLLRFVSIYGYLTASGYSAQGEIDPPIRSTGHVVWLENGLLKGTRKAGATYLVGESVDEFVAVAKLFKRVLALPSGKLPQTTASALADLLENYVSSGVSFILKVAPDRRLYSALAPESLISGLLVRLAQSASGSSFKTCQLARCGTLFAAGVRSGLRADAKFCSSEHRIEHNSRNRAKSRGRG
ncbi:hypothetical protein EDE08_103505 [Bradyrhizobium sp. R2.2-H]|jgi:hypothetical protein|nr:hypothetical protein EDE10_103504 [Bradyrhizobium sp. Y-H1]TCU78053.1 hypothetical protein EDE08_103505 [Bradyrhizobium sp. R2.2-H]